MYFTYNINDDSIHIFEVFCGNPSFTSHPVTFALSERKPRADKHEHNRHQPGQQDTNPGQSKRYLVHATQS